MRRVFFFRYTLKVEYNLTASASGQYFSLVLIQDGEIYGWGRKTEGQMGNGTMSDNSSIEKITSIQGKVIGVTAGFYHCLAFTEDGAIYG